MEGNNGQGGVVVVEVAVEVDGEVGVLFSEGLLLN